MEAALDEEIERRSVKARSMVGWSVRLGASSIVVMGILAWGIATRAPSSAPTAQVAAPAAAERGGGMFYRPTHQMSYRSVRDGSFRLEASASSHPLHFVFRPDIGPNVLRADDARLSGVDISKLAYTEGVPELGSDLHAARATVPMLTFHEVTLFNVEVLVVDGYLAGPILGRDFLKRFDSFDLNREELTLRW
ncbi:MAG TPA: hypothetical protein VMG55_13600 [Stellaceae bacterium]|nr:hypothetical protein [Stellaceae bacterium]